MLCATRLHASRCQCVVHPSFPNCMTPPPISYLSFSDCVATVIECDRVDPMGFRSAGRRRTRVTRGEGVSFQMSTLGAKGFITTAERLTPSHERPGGHPVYPDAPLMDVPPRVPKLDVPPRVPLRTLMSLMGLFWRLTGRSGRPGSNTPRTWGPVEVRVTMATPEATPDTGSP